MMPSRSAVNSHLDAVLGSPGFLPAPRMCALLRYLVEASLEGKADLLKGYAIGIDVFERDTSFDPASDPIVRVQAGRLRRLLNEYYFTEGQNDLVKFQIPKGGYEVLFSAHDPAGRASTQAGDGAGLHKTGSKGKQAGSTGPALPHLRGAVLIFILCALGGFAWWQFWLPKSGGPIVTTGVIRVKGKPISTPVRVRGLEIMFFERPPYHVKEGSRGVMGLFANRVHKIMDHSGIQFSWTYRPASWHLQELKRNERPMCISGWFKNPSRSEYAQFTNAIFKDQQFVVLARSDNARVLRHKSIKTLVADRELSFGSKQTFSYGPQFDKMFGKANTYVISTATDSIGMLDMLLKGMFDYKLVDKAEAEELSRRAGEFRNQIVSIQLSDMPPAQRRYLACSMKVDTALIAKINKSITALGYDKD